MRSPALEINKKKPTEKKDTQLPACSRLKHLFHDEHDEIVPRGLMKNAHQPGP